MKIREVMKRQGVTARELAERLNISISALNQHIAGNPSVKVISSIADALDVPVWSLFDGAPDPQVTAGCADTVTCPKCGASLRLVADE